MTIHVPKKLLSVGDTSESISNLWNWNFTSNVVSQEGNIHVTLLLNIIKLLGRNTALLFVCVRKFLVKSSDPTWPELFETAQDTTKGEISHIWEKYSQVSTTNTMSGVSSPPYVQNTKVNWSWKGKINLKVRKEGKTFVHEIVIPSCPWCKNLFAMDFESNR